MTPLPKLGIFGDSFALSEPYLDCVGHRTIWADVLKEKYDVENFGRSGSSLYYSYKLFIENHKKFDHIIFIATDPGRIQIPERSLHISHCDSDCDYQFVPSYEQAKKILTEIKHIDRTSTSVQAAKEYMLHIQDYEYETYVQKLIIEDIIKERKDIIVIPAFEWSWHPGPFDWNLSQIEIKENNYWNIDHHWFQTWKGKNYCDVRCCHMTQENNIIFGNMVLNWLGGSPINFDLNIFVTPKRENYIVKRDELMRMYEDRNKKF